MKGNGVSEQKRKKKLLKFAFYLGLIALPVLQYIIFYVYVNFNSFVLAFEKVDIYGNVDFVGFDNFQQAISDLFNEVRFAYFARNSMKIYVATLGVGLPLAYMFSYYIYKKGPLSGVYKTVLYIPQIVSSVVLVAIYKVIMDYGYPAIVKAITGETVLGLYTDDKTMFDCILVFTIWAGFGTQVLMYLSAMSGINQSVVEAAELDGVGYFSEMWYITIPMTFTTLSTFLIVSVAGYFNNQMNLFSFGGQFVDQRYQTFGYYLYRELKVYAADQTKWPYLSALGLIFTMVAVPITFGVRWLLGKLGPKQE